MSSAASVNGNGLYWSKPVPERPQLSKFTLSDYPSRSESLLKKLMVQNGTKGPRQAELPLRIIVIGAGLGGLATSIALARRGHNITVLEQAQKLGEVRLVLHISHFWGWEGALLRSWFTQGRRWHTDSTKLGQTTQVVGD
jgi:hypothetical protein